MREKKWTRKAVSIFVCLILAIICLNSLSFAKLQNETSQEKTVEENSQDAN